MSNSTTEHLATLCLHAAEASRAVGAPVAPPIEISTSYHSHPDVSSFSVHDQRTDAPPFYSRWSNPTVNLLEGRMAALEGGEAAVCFASGMAAISALLLVYLKPGDHLVLSNVCYAGAAELAHHLLVRQGVQISAVDSSDAESVAAALRPHTRLVHIETPANPILRLSDIAAIAKLTRAAGVPLSVDATMATPVAIRPLALGADFVVHSMTKYLCGHGDALGGVVVGRQAAMAELRQQALTHLGGALAPGSAWLILRGIETLTARMAAHEANARRVEAYLAQHPKVRRVLWPGSTRHPQHELAQRQMRNFSGMLAFSAHPDGSALARRLAERLRVFAYAVSMGKTKSLIYYIPTDNLLRSSFHLQGEEERKYRDWAGEGVFRVSVGLEDAPDLIEDLTQAL